MRVKGQGQLKICVLTSFPTSLFYSGIENLLHVLVLELIKTFHSRTRVV